MPTPRVALYARVSTERQAESQTIEQQLERLHAYAAQQAWPIGPEQTYRDDGVSGARLDRPALDRLRDAVARGDVDRVLITSPDRLARRYAYQVWLLEEIERAGCAVVFLERPPTGDAQDALVIQIRCAAATRAACRSTRPPQPWSGRSSPGMSKRASPCTASPSA